MFKTGQRAVEILQEKWRVKVENKIYIKCKFE